MLRGALIGVGNVALHGHLPGWQARSDVAIVAATDVRPAQQAEVATRLPGARWFDSADALLAEAELDFVDICTPPSSHAAAVRLALDRRLHVLCEKPLVFAPAELDELAARAAAADRALYTVHNWHHAPIVRRAHELLTAGAIGPLERVSWETLRLRPAPTGNGTEANWRVDAAIGGGGVLIDHGWHVFYIIGRWIGRTPTAVEATLERRRHTDWPVEDTATVRVTFPGVTADILLTWAADTRRTRAELIGRDGVMTLDDEALVLAARGAGEQRWTCPPGLSVGSHHPEWFHRVVDGFLRALTDPAERAANLAEARVCVTLHDRARESSRTKRPVALPPEPAGPVARAL